MKSAGFTLIEVILVVSVTGLLLIIALTGQHQLEAQARFDGAVTKMLQDIAYARAFSQSNVNTEGPGNTTTAELVGAGLEFDNGHAAGQLTEIEPIYAPLDSDGNEIPDSSTGFPQYSNHPQGGACPNASATDPTECFEIFPNEGENLTITSSTIAEIDFINTPNGLMVCHDVGSSYSSLAAACAATKTTPIDFTVQDPEGFTATIRVDPSSGYASRL